MNFESNKTTGSVQANPNCGSRPALRCCRKWTIIVLIVVTALCLAFHDTVLQTATRALVVDESATGHDHALIIEGDKRFDVAHDLYAHDELKKILLFHDAGSNLVRFGILPPGHESAIEELRKRGVPQEAISIVERRAEVTALVDLKAWLEQHDSAKVRVLTARFDARRTRYLIDLTLSDAQAERVRVVGLPDRRFDETNWWKSRTGAKSFVGSMLALIHSYAVGLPPPAKSSSWDPLEYERRLGEKSEVRGQKSEVRNLKPLNSSLLGTGRSVTGTPELMARFACGSSSRHGEVVNNST